MQLVLSEDQELLAKTAADFVADHSPVSRVRALRDSADPVGFSRSLWKQMGELGWLGIPIPEIYGTIVAPRVTATTPTTRIRPFVLISLLNPRRFAAGATTVASRPHSARVPTAMLTTPTALTTAPLRRC